MTGYNPVKDYTVVNATDLREGMFLATGEEVLAVEEAASWFHGRSVVATLQTKQLATGALSETKMYFHVNHEVAVKVESFAF